MTRDLLCPHCGKKMAELSRGKEIREVHYLGDDDCWGHSSTETVPTWKCEDCGIKYIEYTSDYDTMREWIFPKHYTPTITDKQEKYIYSLCGHNARLADDEDEEFWRPPYITSIDLASQWISSHVKEAERLQAEDKLRAEILKSLSQKGWKEHNAFNNYHGKRETELISVDTEEVKSLIRIIWAERRVESRIKIDISTDSEESIRRIAEEASSHRERSKEAADIVRAEGRRLE